MDANKQSKSGKSRADAVQTVDRRYAASNRPVEQRIDHARAAAVQRGVEVLLLLGKEAAIAELEKSDTPGHVILRVISGAAFRRKPADCAL